MAGGQDWDAEKMFQLYVHDYMVKKKMHNAAAIFANEANVSDTPVVIDVPGSFLSEWWSIFYDMYESRQVKPCETRESSSSMVDAKKMETQHQSSSPQVPQLEMNQPRHGQLLGNTDFSKMMAQPAACMAAAKMYEEEHIRQSRNADPNLQFLDVNKLTISNAPPPNIASSSQSQISRQAPKQGLRGIRDARQSTRLGKTVAADTALSGITRGILPSAGPFAASSGINPVPLRGWPLTVPNHKRQVHMSRPEQEVMGHILARAPRNSMLSHLGSSTVTNLDPQNLMPHKSDSYGKGEQVMAQLKWTEGHQHQQHQLQLQHLQESTGKRKTLSHSQPGETLLNREHAEDKPIEEAVECFLSHDYGATDIADSPAMLQQYSNFSNEYKDFSFVEVGHFNTNKNKVLCCHFSSSGKLLATAGHERKVMIWNWETLHPLNPMEGHAHLITDVRFRPNSDVANDVFATSSFDKTVQIWDMARPRKSLLKLVGHKEQVMSLDFHPKKLDLLCSCDSKSEIRLWNVNGPSCTRVTKGANRLVRFQPQVGKLMAAAAGNGVSVIDVETDCLQFYLKGHAKEVRSICWDTSGNYIASVSEDCARIWSVASPGKCIHELHSNGRKFESSTFHSRYPLLLVIGGYQTLELWNPMESSKAMTVQAHGGIISALADSPQNNLIASASHDHSVKLWK